MGGGDRRARRNVRTKKATEDDDEEEEQTSEEGVKVSLGDIKALQKGRQRGKGVSTEVLAKGDQEEVEEKEKEEEEENETQALKGNFETIDNEEDTGEDKNMLNFVERELKRRTGKLVEDDNQTDVNGAKPDDQLYSIPQSLKAKTVSKVEEDSGIQGNWTTGMIEVQLPVQYKLNNIEQTEKAKQKLLERQTHDERVNFTNRNDVASLKRLLPYDHGDTRIGHRAPKMPKIASDSITMSQFIRRDIARIKNRR